MGTPSPSLAGSEARPPGVPQPVSRQVDRREDGQAACLGAQGLALDVGDEDQSVVL
jgi:hypothetical protein